MSAQQAATAVQKIATRGEMSGIRLVHRAPNLDANKETLIAVRSPNGISPALTSLRKERLNMCRPMKTAIPGFLP
jgi:hypothetical protein